MNAHVLLSEFIKRIGEKVIKCEACQAFYLFFTVSINKFNNTGA